MSTPAPKLMSLTPESTIRLTIVALAVGALGLIGFGWKANAFLHQILDEVGRTRAEVKTMSDNQWTVMDQQLWAYEFKDMNQGKGVLVPIPTSKARP